MNDIIYVCSSADSSPVGCIESIVSPRLLSIPGKTLTHPASGDGEQVKSEQILGRGLKKVNK